MDKTVVSSPGPALTGMREASQASKVPVNRGYDLSTYS
jgi:hypothetical protein